MKNKQRVSGWIVLMLFLFAGACRQQAPVKVLFPGNWADPTLVKVGEEYYLTSNNDNHIPSVLVFRSRDLRRWEPLVYASPSVGQGPATDIALHEDKLYIYGGGGRNAWVMISEPPYASWSERINMQPVAPHGIDAGHISDDEGNRYLYTNQGKIVHISKDGLETLTAPEKVYAIYHGYMNGQRSLGRCTLISPVEWKNDEWPVLSDRWPRGWDMPIVIDLPLSDDFSGDTLGLQWQSLRRFDPQRYTLSEGKLEVTAMGTEPGASSSPVKAKRRSAILNIVLLNDLNHFLTVGE